MRVADALPSLDDLATFVALVRGLAASVAVDAAAAGGTRAVPGQGTPLHALRAAGWRAARHGLEDRLVDPRTGRLAGPDDVLHGLLDRARPGLEACGDLETAQAGVARWLRDGNGAMRQRAAFARAGWPGVVDVVRVRPDAAPDGLAPARSTASAGTSDGAAQRAVDGHRITEAGAPEAPRVPPTDAPGSSDAAREDRAAGRAGDGNGWVDCACGHRHWGLHGAAGLLVARPADGEPEVLLRLRAVWTHQGGTWGLPGGARDSIETTGQAARREASEEVGLDPRGLTDLGSVVVDHGSWSYTTVLVAAPAGTSATPTSPETDAAVWTPLSEVAARPLHPGLAETWPGLRARLEAADLRAPAGGVDSDRSR
ncbi:hypothetical protein GCM10025868_44580 [Angustibacter aerolatus]|uniref:Nudix hydrolase domain-containing protein n=1 Tax=Angustibacter aerolatus TaxID=1162965 RepID=A0ABQ6JPA2_9ACTN|nr:hypothetical protein GCM10025868_44580 [Angustibacter aerolatus]